MDVYLLTDKEISKLQGTSNDPNVGLLEAPIIPKKGRPMRRYIYLVLTVSFLIGCATTEKQQPSDEVEKPKKRVEAEESEQEKESEIHNKNRRRDSFGKHEKSAASF